MSQLQIILAILFAFLMISIAGWALVRGATLGEDDPEECEGYIDQDGEGTPSRHQWRNAGMKAHHAEQ